MRMEGEIDQPARTLEFRLWQPGMSGPGGAGSAMTPGSGAESSAEARIEGDRTYLPTCRCCSGTHHSAPKR